MGRSYRFLLTPRWLGLMALVLVLCAAFVRLGIWQLHRLDERKARNAVITGNLARPAAPVDAVLAAGRAATGAQQWRTVTATGRYDTDHTILLRNQSNDGVRGFDVLVPLVIGDDTALVVDRGWIPAGQSARSRVDVPAPADGLVTVTGRVRLGAGGSNERSAVTTDTAQPSVGSIDVSRLAKAVPYPLYGAYVEMIKEDPAAGGSSPVIASPPEVSEGPHLAYAIQWFLFCGIAVGGLVVLARQERRDAASTDAAGSRPESDERLDYGSSASSTSDLA